MPPRSRRPDDGPRVDADAHTTRRRQGAAMQNEVTTLATSSPLIGVTMAAGGAIGYCCVTVSKWFGAATVLAQAPVPGTAITLDTAAQVVFGILSILGTVMAFVRAERRKNADDVRDGWLKDGLARIQLQVAQQQVSIKAHLAKQDDALAAIQQASTAAAVERAAAGATPTPESAAPPAAEKT